VDERDASFVGFLVISELIGRHDVKEKPVGLARISSRALASVMAQGKIGQPSGIC
jgi:hypothetical protein